MAIDIERLVGNNLGMMKSIDRGGMRYLLNRESVGGNAGTGLACVNFRYTDLTGEFLCFANEQDVPEEWRSVVPEGYFLISRTMDSKKDGIIVEYNLPKITCKSAIRVLLSSIFTYNSWRDAGGD